VVAARKSFAIVFLTLASLLVGSSSALAAAPSATPAGGANTGHDPSAVGSAIKGILAPNAKDLWWCGLVVGLLGVVFARRGSKAAGILFMLVGAGLVIFNSVGVQDMMTNIANRVI
jgi:hypothetical protein